MSRISKIMRTCIIPHSRDQLICIPRAASVQYLLCWWAPHSNLLTTIYIIIIDIVSGQFEIQKKGLSFYQHHRPPPPEDHQRHSPVESAIRAMLRAGQPLLGQPSLSPSAPELDLRSAPDSALAITLICSHIRPTILLVLFGLTTIIILNVIWMCYTSNYILSE